MLKKNLSVFLIGSALYFHKILALSVLKSTLMFFFRFVCTTSFHKTKDMPQIEYEIYFTEFLWKTYLCEFFY